MAYLRNIFLIILPVLALGVATLIILLALMPYHTLAQQEVNENHSVAPDPLADQPWFSDKDNLLVLVDREHALPKDFKPSDLVFLKEMGVPTSNPELQGRLIAVEALKKMFASALEEGYHFYIFSGYRSYETQQRLYQYWIAELGYEEAVRSSALPGYSEHHLGTAFDISAYEFKGDIWKEFGDSLPGQWLAENAYRFGFVMSYPKGKEKESGYIYEPWHFRYVGVEVASIIKEKQIVPSIFIRELNMLRQRLY